MKTRTNVLLDEVPAGSLVGFAGDNHPEFLVIDKDVGLDGKPRRGLVEAETGTRRSYVPPGYLWDVYPYTIQWGK